MSRTSQTLLRLGVPTLAAATMLGGVPAFLGTANAAHVNNVTLTPDTSSATAGTCVPFTARIAFNAGQTPRTETIDVQIDEIDFDSATAGNQSSATADVDFCTAPTSTSNGTTTTTRTPATQQAGGTDTGAAGTSDRAEFTATVDEDDNDANTLRTASVTFGVTVNEPGTVNVRAFYEVEGTPTDNDQFDASEFSDTSVATFAAGGANRSRDVEVISQTDAFGPGVAPVANADVDRALEGETRTFRVRVADAENRTLAGVPVTFTTAQNPGDEGDRGPAFFATTDNSGIATGTITFPARDEAASADTVTFFVNRTDLATTSPGVDPGEDSDTSVVTIQDNAPQQNRTVDLIALTDGGNAFNSINGDDDAVNSVRDNNRTFRALVDDPRATGSDDSTAGTLLSFAVSGGSGDETITVTNPTAGGRTNECTTTLFAGDDDREDPNNSSACEVTVTDPTPRVGQSLSLVATVRGTAATDTGTVFFRNEPQDARNISLTPETVTTTTNTAQTLTARVIDADGNGVAGVPVTFTESGPGAFRNGQSANTVTTDSSGNAVIEVISLPGETGAQTVTATIPNVGNQTRQAAGAGQDAEGNNVPTTQPAGNNTDSSTVTFVNTLPSPSASASATPSASASATPTATASPSVSASPGTGVTCTNPAGISLSRSTIIPGRAVRVTVTTAPNAVVELQAYSRPSTTFRVVRTAEAGANGVVTFDVTPGTNTRLFANCVSQTASVSRQVVINVRTALSLTVVRNGTRNYTFQGRILPRRADQLITLYRVTSSGERVLTSQIRTDDSGTYRINRRFTGSGTFGFLTRTGQTLTNAAGESNTPTDDASTEAGNGRARPTAIF